MRGYTFFKPMQNYLKKKKSANGSGHLGDKLQCLQWPRNSAQWTIQLSYFFSEIITKSCLTPTMKRKEVVILNYWLIVNSFHSQRKVQYCIIATLNPVCHCLPGRNSIESFSILLTGMLPKPKLNHPRCSVLFWLNNQGHSFITAVRCGVHLQIKLWQSLWPFFLGMILKLKCKKNQFQMTKNKPVFMDISFPWNKIYA